jgi:anti-anti-sigma regulatory factor
MVHAALIDRLEPGDHVCWTFRQDSDRDAVLAAYVAGALPRGQKVVYFSHATTPAQTLQALAQAGIDVEAVTSSGQLEVHSARSAYLGTGAFDPAAMVSGCLAACEEAKTAGFAGLRLAGDMSWAVEPVDGVDGLGGYEARVNEVYAGGYALGLCLYDGRLFAPARMKPLIAVHPGFVDPTTDDTWSPLMRLRWDADRTVLRVDGASDLSNRASLVALLDALPAGDGANRPVLDVSALDFADVATVHSIVVAAARSGGLRVIGASALLARLLDHVGASRVSGLVVERAVRGCA